MEPKIEQEPKSQITTENFKDNRLPNFVKVFYWITLISIIIVTYNFITQGQKFELTYGWAGESSEGADVGVQNLIVIDYVDYALGLPQCCSRQLVIENTGLMHCDIFYQLVESAPKKFALLRTDNGRIFEGTAYFMTLSGIYKVTPELPIEGLVRIIDTNEGKLIPGLIPIKGNTPTFLLKMGVRWGKETGITNPPYLFYILLPLTVALIGHIAKKL